MKKIAGITLSCKTGISSDEHAGEDYWCEAGTGIHDNIEKLALGISCNKAVLLRGPVGSGKTTIVEYLANVTGRHDNLLKVQLGEHTDSKVLLGNYQCTHLPGQFIWQPGILTKAVVDGNWLLLEDIDSVSSDVLTLLACLVKTKTLSVPGYRFNIQQHDEFRLFATQRTQHNMSVSHKQWTDWFVIECKQLTQTELASVIQLRHPKLTVVASKLSRLLEEVSQVVDTAQARAVSSRDLFKLCSRADKCFVSGDQTTSLLIYLYAVQIFCSSHSSDDVRSTVAERVGNVLGIVKNKAPFLTLMYKPTILITDKNIKLGCVVLERKQNVNMTTISNTYRHFSLTPGTCRLLEQVGCCISNHEPVLLVGETGCGKTTCLQYLTDTLGRKLMVINMNQQSDTTDLLGGYKPVDMSFVIQPVWEELKTNSSMFNDDTRTVLLTKCHDLLTKKLWKLLIQEMIEINRRARGECKKMLSVENLPDESKSVWRTWQLRWIHFVSMINKLKDQFRAAEKSLVFSFVDGTLVTAVKKGYWVLLDEINLATSETLDCLCGLLEGITGSISLLDKGETKPVKRHPDFRLFAAMNPATDVGKKQLPFGLRNRFTEIYVPELKDKCDLLPLVETYLSDMSLPPAKLVRIVDFYTNVRKEAETNLLDGTGRKPHYSLRSLCRALSITSTNPCKDMNRSLYEGLCVAFLTQLDNQSYNVVKTMIANLLSSTGCNVQSMLAQHLHKPTGGRFVQFEGYWIPMGAGSVNIQDNYILTDTVKRHLHDLLRVVSFGNSCPVLLQGDTSVGKTSMIQYLAQGTGNRCTRVNNHEHTDIQEYIGTYVADCEGKLVFQEGILCQAMRNGYWLILDELNLAPTEVLEALNRVLDDNRELFIPETHTKIKAHPQFMLFATQNPPGMYGGRKQLSRAFRNRFVELNFDQIPSMELAFILEKRCRMPPSYCKKMVKVMLELQYRRKQSNIFVGKSGFITLRDLFRWGERYHNTKIEDKFYDWDQHLSDEGYMLLAGRVRINQERTVIKQVIGKHFNREVNEDNLFSLHDKTSQVTRSILQQVLTGRYSAQFKHVTWTKNMRRLAVLVWKAIKMKEPVLLVGETGCGKTTIVQMLAEMNEKQLNCVNCHMHSEGADFLGGLRPCRDVKLRQDGKLFMWYDGPLVTSVKDGGYFLADEISLADDSVLERLNSLLEPERTLLISEKGGTVERDVITAVEGFQFFATMNPGGDYGKKELSPALRNRFTEIWTECDVDDLIDIVSRNIHHTTHDTSFDLNSAVVSFIRWYKDTEFGTKNKMTARDLLTWIELIKRCSGEVSVCECYVHGGCMSVIDRYLSGTPGWSVCVQFLLNQLTDDGVRSTIRQQLDKQGLHIVDDESRFGVEPFYITTGCRTVECSHNTQFVFHSPTITYNVLRVMRALQMNKAILLEGSPGVGKTSLIAAVARVAGFQLTRINLSDQTDIADLFGVDLPEEGASAGSFSWRDGPLLTALKQGQWIVLDELNLASQSVLEGLNAVLDHRGSVYIPELNRTFYVDENTKLFACQNPLSEGGNRKGLPKSFLNRFTKVVMEQLTSEDYLTVLYKVFHMLDPQLIGKMVKLNELLCEDVKQGRLSGNWELNLRDLVRWCEAVSCGHTHNVVQQYMLLLYYSRARCVSDRNLVLDRYKSCFGADMRDYLNTVYVTDGQVVFGDLVTVDRQQTFVYCEVEEFDELVGRNKSGSDCGTRMRLLDCQSDVLWRLTCCVNNNWLAILVGACGSGKTSVVKTLSTLASRQLKTIQMNSAMDTTEILGGFEQTDYLRRLEEKVETVKTLVLSAAKYHYCDGHVDKCDQLLTKYKHFCDLSLNNGDSQKYFKNRISSLLNLITDDDVLCYKPNIDICNVLVQQLDELKCQYNVKCGGKFEWIDSLLVQCLQKGYWLLLEDVNLCSSAVLDRLNSLFEPDGSLTINERGSDDSSSCVVLKPHPEFRVFMTMDPKNGPISRAMSNRGVEIYLSTQDLLTKLDVKLLISDQGVECHKQQQQLVSVGSNINELIFNTYWTRNYQLHGYTWTTAMKKVCGVELMDEQDTDETLEDCFVIRLARPDLHLMLNNTIDTRIRQYCSLLETMLNILSSQSVDVSSVLVDPRYTKFLTNILKTECHTTTSTSVGCMLQYLLLNCYLITDDVTRQRLQQHIDHLLGFHINKLQHSHLVMYLNRLRELNSIVYKCADKLQWDTSWLSTTNEQQAHKTTSALCYNFINNVSEVKMNVQVKSSMTLEQYCDYVRRSVNEPGHVLLTNIKPLLDCITQLMSDCECGLSCVVDWKWLFVIKEMFTMSDVNEELLIKFTLVVDWFINKTVSQLLAHTTTDSSKLKKLQECVSVIQSSSDLTRLTQFGERFRQEYGHPDPSLSLAIPMSTIDIERDVAQVHDEIVLEMLTHLSVVLGVYVSRILLCGQDDVYDKVNTFLDLLKKLPATEHLNNLYNSVKQHRSPDDDINQLVFNFNQYFTTHSTSYTQPVLTKLVMKHVDSIQQRTLLNNITLVDTSTITRVLLSNIDQTMDSRTRIHVFDVFGNENIKLKFQYERIVECVRKCSEPRGAGDVKFVDQVDQLLSTVKQGCNPYDWSKLGMITCLLLKQCNVDPVFKNKLKHHLAVQQVSRLADELYTHECNCEITGTNTQHPYLKHVRLMLAKQDNIISKYKHLSNIERSVVQFNKLMGHVGGYVINMLPKISQLSTHTGLDVVQSLSTSTVNFINLLNNDYLNSFPDVVLPLLAVVSQVSYGLVLGSARCEASSATDDKLAADLCSFPMSTDNLPELTQQHNTQLLLTHVSNVVNKWSVSVCQSDVRQLIQLSTIFVNLWNDQQYKLEREKADKESPYMTKSSTEQTDEEARVEMFPTYEQYYTSDVVSDGEVKLTCLNIQQLHQITQVITLVLKQQYKLSWLRHVNNVDGCNVHVDFVTPLLTRFELLKRLDLNLSPAVDVKLTASLVILSSEQDCINSERQFQLVTLANDQVYDIYKHSNVEQSARCVSVLSELQARVVELLTEWPEHPALNEINKIIKRIFEFSLKSPLMKLLTGLEFVLKCCQEWEKIAHSGVSLSQHLTNITNVIVDWRKLELQRWRLCLENVSREMKIECCKWWAIMKCTLDQLITNYTESDYTQFVNTCQLLMEKSPYGEYQTRLDILLTFHIYVLHYPQSAHRDKLSVLLLNVYKLYSQYIDAVSGRLSQLVSPLEKKLKDFVKIAKWNDVSYWSVKQDIDRTHRTLFKFMKQYKEILSTQVDLHELAAVKVRSSKNCKQHKQVSSCQVDNFLNIEMLNLAEDSLLHRRNKLYSKTCKIYNRLQHKIPFTLLSDCVHHLTGRISDETKYLRNLSPHCSLDKDKRKSNIKNIQQLKRRALSELLNKLQTIGVRYKAGLLFDMSQVLEYHCSPLHVDVGESDVNKPCGEDYYWNCVTKMMRLELALKKPNKDIGSQIIEKLRGCSTHLMVLIKKQNSCLSKTKCQHFKLNKHLNKLISLSSKDCSLSNESQLSHQHELVTNCLANVVLTLKQFGVVLNCWPTSAATSDHSYLTLGLSSGILRCCKTDTTYLTAKQLVEEMLQSVSAHYNTSLTQLTVTYTGDVMSIDEVNDGPSIDHVRASVDCLSAVVNQLTKLCSLFECCDDGFVVDNPLVEPLKELHSNIQTTLVRVNDVDQSTPMVSHCSNINKQADNLLEKILISLQTVYNKYKDSESFKGQLVAEDVEQLINKHLVDSICEDVNNLQLDNINKMVGECLKSLQQSDNLLMQPTLLACVPFLTQLHSLHLLLLTHLESSYRSTSKLLSVLLTTFTHLASDGFCQPPEQDDDDAGDSGQGKTGQGGVGLADGQGKVDISDQIESEDQLEDARPQGEDNKDEDSGNECPEEDKGVEMSEDFTGKTQDVDKTGGEDSEEENNEGEEEPEDKEMGETGEDCEQLDQQLWGSDEEDDGDDEKDNVGAGQGAEQQDDHGERGEGDDDGKQDDRKQVTDKKDINEMEDKDVDDDQVDPYHGNQQPELEPELLDLPDNLQLDDGEEKEQQDGDENPFDIDEMKEFEEQKEKEGESEVVESKPEGEEENDTSEEEEEDKTGAGQTEDTAMDVDDGEDKDDENRTLTADVDQSHTNDPVQPAPDCNKSTDTGAAEVEQTAEQDKVTNDDEAMEDHHITSDKQSQGTGQADVENTTQGHKSTESRQQFSSAKQESKKKRRDKPGTSNEDRTLGDASEPVEKKLKTVDRSSDGRDVEEGEENVEEGGELKQHVKEAKQGDKQVMDVATQEQVEKQKPRVAREDEDVNKDDGLDTDEMEVDEQTNEDDGDNDTSAELHSQQLGDNKSDKDKNTLRKDNKCVEQQMEEVQVEGDNTETCIVQRGTETRYYTRQDVVDRLDLTQLRQQIQQHLDQLQVDRGKHHTGVSYQTWQMISATVDNLSRELTEQLRLVLEPTVTSRLQGDYRTGRRINMRKVISYIASEFRKDRIWLRRTKPWKRDHRIILAIDDSSSMIHNESKELAFECLALVSKSLTMLESGDLAVVSFGENTKVLHSLGEPFTDDCGPRLLEEFTFDQKRTNYGEMLNISTALLKAQTRSSSHEQAELVLIISDGRNVAGYGLEKVQQAVREAVDDGTFIVFVIIDNPKLKTSIMDIRTQKFENGKFAGFKSYMEDFPFPYYLILRDISSLPHVLSDALRQWFQLLSTNSS